MTGNAAGQVPQDDFSETVVVNLLHSADGTRQDEDFAGSSAISPSPFSATPNQFSKPKKTSIAVSSLDDSPLPDRKPLKEFRNEMIEEVGDNSSKPMLPGF